MAIGPVILSWYAADLKTGVILEELHSLKPSGPFGCKLGMSTTANFDLEIAGAPPQWVDATQPGRTMLVAVDQQTSTPIWAGLILTRQRGSADTASFGCATPEAYLDRRYTGDVSYLTATDQAVIMTGLGTALATNAPNFVFDAPSTGTTTTYSVQDGDDRTILSTWQELMGQEGGPEWTVGVAWQDTAQTTFKLPITVRATVGVQSAHPEAVFDMPGCVADYSQTESYESDKGATDVLAWGDGQGATRLKSSVHTATTLLAQGWPSWVYRYTPAAGLDDPTQLDAHAAEALAQMQTGSSAWTIDAVASRAPRIGSDWGLGDTVRLQVLSSPGHPSGVDMTARAYSWQLDPDGDKLTPILVEG